MDQPTASLCHKKLGLFSGCGNAVQQNLHCEPTLDYTAMHNIHSACQTCSRMEPWGYSDLCEVQQNGILEQ